jgi:hypothetical protein
MSASWLFAPEAGVHGVVGSLVIAAGNRALMYMVTTGRQAAHLLSINHVEK